MKPDRCSFCKGKLVKGITEFVVKVEDEILVIKMSLHISVMNAVKRIIPRKNLKRSINL